MISFLFLPFCFSGFSSYIYILYELWDYIRLSKFSPCRQLSSEASRRRLSSRLSSGPSLVVSRHCSPSPFVARRCRLSLVIAIRPSLSLFVFRRRYHRGIIYLSLEPRAVAAL